MEYAIFLLLGIGVGTFGTLVGIGGGLILVPFFIFFWHANRTRSITRGDCCFFI